MAGANWNGHRNESLKISECNLGKGFFKRQLKGGSFLLAPTTVVQLASNNIYRSGIGKGRILFAVSSQLSSIQ
ncbi:hypothetical protein J6590_005053 [Homalodisca vitripennis]|nr:hypothetical protein J6590_005053 [Homalodisca vitripennis]